MRFTRTQQWTMVVCRGDDTYMVPYNPKRVRWIKMRNGLIEVLKLCGVRIEHRCRIANGIMKQFFPFPKTLYDRKNIKKSSRSRSSVE